MIAILVFAVAAIWVADEWYAPVRACRNSRARLRLEVKR